MDFDQVFAWIISHPTNYPGKHQESQPRTASAFKPLEPQSQFHIILKATAEYIRENLQNGKSVNLRGFGAFSFEIISDTVKPALFTSYDFKKELNEHRSERKHVHAMRPCFIVDPKFRYYLTRYPGKEEISFTKSQHSLYQQGFAMIFCNPGPIAASCYLAKEVVASAHEALIKAIYDLTKLGSVINLDFGFVKVKLDNKDLSYKYKNDFASSLNKHNFETKIRKSDIPTNTFWKTSFQTKWMNSTLSNLLKQPDTEKVQNLSEKTIALKIMSLDLNTSEKAEVVRHKTVTLPKLGKQ